MSRDQGTGGAKHAARAALLAPRAPCRRRAGRTRREVRVGPTPGLVDLPWGGDEVELLLHDGGRWEAAYVVVEATSIGDVVRRTVVERVEGKRP